LFTGFRKIEVFTLKWEHVLEDRVHLPMTKNGRSFDLPILQLHHKILARLRPLSGDWVFPSLQSETGHIMRPVRFKYNPHMHRRTFAMVAMQAGVLGEIVGWLLNHKPLSISCLLQRYRRRYQRPFCVPYIACVFIAFSVMLTAGEFSLSRCDLHSVLQPNRSTNH
jgi:hypothetical protein